MNKPHVGRQQFYWELHCRHSHGNFPKHLKQHPQLFLLANLSITTKGNLFWRSDFLKKQTETKRVDSCLTHCSQKQKKKQKKEMNKKSSQVFLKIGLPNRKNYGENEK